MRERGYDLRKHASQSLADLPDIEFDFVATMGCGDTCPFVRAKEREDWGIADPKEMSLDEFRAVRDQIEDNVKRALAGVLSRPEKWQFAGSRPLGGTGN